MITPYAESRLMRIIARLRAETVGGPKAKRIKASWVRRPELKPEKPICVFVALARDGRILKHSKDLARCWFDAGFDVVVVVVVREIEDEINLDGFDFASGLLLRCNRGYDFGAWSAAINELRPDIAQSKMLAIANDSVLGPSRNFGNVVNRALNSHYDVIGMTDSYEMAHHFQSYTVFFKGEALRSDTFWRFWSSVRSGDRHYVIENYEVTMRGRLAAAGLRTEAIFPSLPHKHYNPTILTWRALVEAGYPYLKIELLRAAPWHVLLESWETHASAHGFDVNEIHHQLIDLETVDKEHWAYHRAGSEAKAPTNSAGLYVNWPGTS